MLGPIAREIGEEVAEQIGKKVAPKVASAVKKPLKWGFEGRKKTDIKPYAYDMKGKIATFMDDKNYDRFINEQYKKLERGATKNKTIKKIIDLPFSKREKLSFVNRDFSMLEKIGVPRELTGKMIGNDLGLERYLSASVPIELGPGKNFSYREKTFEEIMAAENAWKSGWLRYYNELNKAQQETFDVLSDGWQGSVNELVDTVKRLV